MKKLMLASVLVFGACGDDGGGSPGPGTAAKRTPENAARLKTAPTEVGGGLAALGQIYGDLQVIVLDKQTKDLSAKSGALGYAQGALGYVDAALNMDCVAQTATSVTYTDCTEGPATFNGTAQLNGDRVTFDVTVDVDPDAYNGPIQQASMPGGPKMTLNAVDVRETGDLTITDSALKGVIDATITLDMTVVMPVVGEQQVPQTTKIKAVFDLQRDTSGCAVGGTLVVTSGETTATAEYGPACGQVKLR